MTDFQAIMADFVVRQAEREAQAQVQIEHLKQAVVPLLHAAGIAHVEIRFDGCGDSGAVEECVCLGADGASLACPDAVIEHPAADEPEASGDPPSPTLFDALESLTYLALECHHPGWENNDGAYGELVIDVAEARFVLECSLRFTASHDHSTGL